MRVRCVMLRPALTAVVFWTTTMVNATEPHTDTDIHRERIEWCDVWVPDADRDDRIRVLLIGDSITKGYYGAANDGLKDIAAVARFATSAFMGDPAFVNQLDALLDHYDFTVIHFNNGLHGWGYTEADYADALADITTHIRAKQPQATLVLANSTPLRQRGNLSAWNERNERVKERNRIMTAFAGDRDIVLNDLYKLVENDPELWTGDGTHFGNEGRLLQGKQVAAVIRKALGHGEQP